MLKAGADIGTATALSVWGMVDWSVHAEAIGRGESAATLWLLYSLFQGGEQWNNTTLNAFFPARYKEVSGRKSHLD